MNESVSVPSTVGRWVGLSALLLGIALVVSAYLIQSGYVKSKDLSSVNMATLTGTADQVVTSDKVKWSVQLSRSSTGTTERLTNQLEADQAAVRDALKKAGVTDADISVQPMSIQPAYDSYSSGYASQVLVIESKMVEEVGGIADSIGNDFAKRGATATTNSIEFYYSGTNDLQKTLTKKALEDARSQAKDLFGDQVKRVSSVASSQLIITPENASISSYNYGYGTSSETSSIKKRITVNLSVSLN